MGATHCEIGLWLPNKTPHLPNIVEISVRHAFQLLQLCHLIKHFVEVELRAQEIKPPVAVGFSEK